MHNQATISIHQNEVPVAESRILIVDDNIENVRLLSAILKEEHYKIAVAISSEDALSVIPLFKPELILLDINLLHLPVVH